MSDRNDRDKLSFSERDKKQRERRPGDDRAKSKDAPRPNSAAYRSYKSQLNKLFDGGSLPDAMKEKLKDAGVDTSGEKKELAALVLSATGDRKVLKALKGYREKFGFPSDEALLAKLLDVDDEDVVLEVFETIEQLKDEGALKRGASLKARIKAAMMTVDVDDVQSRGAVLLKKL